MSETGSGISGVSAESEVGPSVDFGNEIASMEAGLINSNFTLVAYGAAHGSTEDRFRSIEVVTNEYDAVASVVDRLNPANGDALFVEALGHDGTYALTLGSPIVESLEDKKNARSISAFGYAVELAFAKGLPIIPADLDYEALEQFNHATGQNALLDGLNPEWSYYGAFHSSREEAAAKTVKDHALAALPALDGRTPTYALLFGPAHFGDKSTDIPEVGNKTPGIPTAFNRLGLHVEARMLPNAMRERYLTYIAELLTWLPHFPGAPDHMQPQVTSGQKDSP